MKQAFYPIDLRKDIRLLTGLLRISYWGLLIIENDNHRGGEGGRGVPHPPS
jgi:hypothetical protein